MSLGEKIAIGVVGIDLLLIALVAIVRAGQDKQQRRQEWREIRQPPDQKGPPND